MLTENKQSITNIKCLTDNIKDKCDQFPTLDECKETVMDMKHNKSPGLDGLPAEFYQCFWDQLSELFFEMLTEIFRMNEMTFSQRLAILSLIHKKGERFLLKNYRPISLTNTDYKIIAFIFARRLQKIIDDYISKEQTANNNEEGLLLFLDFEKAFDSIEWNFLFKTLEKFNFGSYFIKWINILYKNTIFRLKNNGWITRTCRMKRGIRQGCPISAILYIFVAEILSNKINNNNSIEGFTTTNFENEIKSIQQADEMILTLKNIESLKQAIKTTNKFCELAGSKINISKTESILLGILKDKHKTIEGINVTKTAVKTLGIYIGHDKAECYNKNWMKTYHEMEKLFESWKRRKLSNFWKCTIINSNFSIQTK